jgi:hypothetical protein
MPAIAQRNLPVTWRTSSPVAHGPRSRPVLAQPEGYNLTLFRTSRTTGGNCPENTIENGPDIVQAISLTQLVAIKL